MPAPTVTLKEAARKLNDYIGDIHPELVDLVRAADEVVKAAKRIAPGVNWGRDLGEALAAFDSISKGEQP